MRPKDQALYHSIDRGLVAYHQGHYRLLGIQNGQARAAFLAQVLESVHRVQYPSVIGTREVSQLRADPKNPLFDPLKAAVFYQRKGEIDEAFWLIFVFVHFGKHSKAGWRLARDVYGGYGGTLWNWANTSSYPDEFRRWLSSHQKQLKEDGVLRRFGNHRKYESLNAWSNTGTGAAVASYVEWVKPHCSHLGLIEFAQKSAGVDAKKTFDFLYKSMRSVRRFGRTARFDYLTMIGKLRLAQIEPGSTYMEGATGPYSGARLLFNGNTTSSADRREMDKRLVQLGELLGVGMQVLEDALCNWQKSPKKFIAFRG